MTEPHFPIGIIGGTGGIGRWFADFFTGEDYTVYVSGKNAGPPPREMADLCEVVIIAVPIGASFEVIEETGPFLREESLLMDLTSLKEATVKSMLSSSLSEVIGLHPLFGPAVPSLYGQNVIVCPSRTSKWLPWITGILERQGARITLSTPEYHDEIMSLVQALNHLETIALALALRGSGTSSLDLDKFSTPIFRTKTAILKKMLAGNPRLYAEIITFNPNIDKVLDLYIQGLSELKDLVGKKDAQGLADLIKQC
jgi:prephenate dehydrogenase